MHHQCKINTFILLQVDKVVQLYETMMTRHCTMLVGPTGGGKTVILHTIVKSQTLMGLPTKLTVLNPKVRQCLHHFVDRILLFIIY